MKNYLFIIMAIPAMLLSSCGMTQTNNVNILTAREFSEKTKVDSTSIIVDVRTPEEFSEGHLINARNIDWNGSDFEKQIETLDPSKPVYVYCLSGKRSAAAAQKMRSKGFKQVYELQGGITKWREAKLSETMGN